MALPIVVDVEQPLGFWPARNRQRLCGYAVPCRSTMSERDRPAYGDVTRRVHPLYTVSGVLVCLYQVDF